MKTSVLIRTLGLVLSVVLLVSILELSSLYELLTTVSWPYVSLALTLMLFRQVLLALRWRLLNTERTEQPPLLSYFIYVMASTPVNLISPGLLGFDVSRGIMLGRDAQTEKGEQVLSVLADRIVGLLSIVLLGFFSLLLVPELPGWSTYMMCIVVMLLGILGGLLLVTSPVVTSLGYRTLDALGISSEKLRGVVATWERVVKEHRNSLSRVGKSLAFSFGVHLCGFGAAFLLAEQLGIGVSFGTITIVFSIVYALVVLPISFLGLGVSELSFVYLLSFQGVSPELATALSLQFFSLNIALCFFGLPFLWFLPKQERVTT